MRNSQLYKYRAISTLESCMYLMDIILNERLYAASFDMLNDPMEGVYYNAGLTLDQICDLKNEKESCRIVSLSKTHTDGFMWVFYADECRGCCIEVEPKEEWKHDDIHYDSKKLKIEEINPNLANTTNEILFHKLKRWKYEKEVRYVKYNVFEDECCYLPVKIKRIYLGHKTDSKVEKLIQGWVDLKNQEKEKNKMIKVCRMTRKQYKW